MVPLLEDVRMNQAIAATSGDKWVVGVDGSDCSLRALDWAARHVVGRASTFEVVTAWESSLFAPEPSSDLSDQNEEGPPKRAARAAAAAAADRVRKSPDLTVEHRATHGGASVVLLDAADDAELLVVGNRGLGGFRRLVLGSTSAQVVAHSVNPTVVVRHEPPAGPDRLLVAVDGSDNSYAAANWALQFATPGTVVTLAMVWDPSLLQVTRAEVASQDARKSAESAFNVWVDALSDSIGTNPATAGIEIARDFSAASPRPRLKELSDESTLFVVGARGHGAVGAMMLGSVSTWLLHHVDVPMAVVPIG